MAINRTWIMLLLSAMILSEVATGHSSNATTEATEYLKAHNLVRAEVGVEPLQWNQTLANDANFMVEQQRETSGCEFADLGVYIYGVNQMWRKGKSVSPSAVVEEWVKQRSFYDYPSNSCKKGHKCMVYTQVVWAGTSQVGCAQTTCQSEGATLAICFYRPQGNLVNTKPY